MFMKQYNYKPRSGSQSSQSGSGSAIERTDNAARADSPPAKVAATGNTSPVSAAIAGRRRSSDVSGKFSGLQNHKRNSQDAGAAERKASWADAAPGTGGILSGMWNNFTKGSK